ncbi:MAG: GNAT family N-acetyltransferase [Candidatus Staskawiczbacteria bacterium]|nr:GNAT family N-acetyltransferase [Candidatus Staskawiczbacteria bacterium]
MSETNESRIEQESSPEGAKEITLKRATLEDTDAILAVEKSLEGQKIYSALTNREEVIEEITKSFVYLIEQQARVIGDVSYEMKDENHAYISGFAVMPEFQGRGIAKQAIKMILEQLKDVELIDLVTHPENEKSIKLYKSFGFQKIGEPQENYFGDGEPRIRMVLEKKK